MEKFISKYITMLLGVLVMMLSFPSCTDQDDVEMSYGASINVSAAQLFASFQEVETGNFDLSQYPDWEIELTSYVYDASGNLVDETNQRSANITTTLHHQLDLLPGKYKTVSIARFGKKEGSDLSFYWVIKDPSSLATLTIEEADEAYMQFHFETLGVCIKDITIDNQPQNIAIEIPPVTGLLEVFLWAEDMTGLGTNKGDYRYSELVPYCKEINIWATNLKQKVTFADGVIAYGYGAQNKDYRIAQFSPKTRFINGSKPNEYMFRAILPIEGRDFYWDLSFDEGKGAEVGLLDFNVSDYSTKLNIESGKQYTLDLVLDGKYLFAQDHYPDEDMTKRREKQIERLNAMTFAQIMDRNFETYLGSSRSLIEGTFGTSYDENGGSLFYFYYNLYVFALRFVMDETTDTVNTIRLYFQNLNDDFKERMINYLSERFFVYEKGTDQHLKAFMNAESYDNATVGVTWNLDEYQLTYFKLK